MFAVAFVVVVADDDDDDVDVRVSEMMKSMNSLLRSLRNFRF